MSELDKPDVSGVDVGELIKLCALDNNLYCRTWFPKTFRQRSPEFHAEMWDALENPAYRYLNISAFRDSAKTTLLRAFMSKRVAYGLSKTILYIGVSETKALQSIRWLKRQVETNEAWRHAYGLSKGSKWQEHEIEVVQELGTAGTPNHFRHTIWLLGVGINGSLRGINFDDYRPDLIIADDVIDDENAASMEQREKIADMIFGTVKDSLAPVVDEPNAKLVMLNTPLHLQDVSYVARKDSQFRSLVFPIWTKETMDLTVDEQISAWEERHPTASVRLDKQAAARRNRLSIFVREKECRIISTELAAFRKSWIQHIEPKHMGTYSVLAVDPVPPPSEREVNKGFVGKSFECQVVWSVRPGGGYMLQEYHLNRGHDPNWSIKTFFDLATRYRISTAIVESINYQRTLRWLIEKEMGRRRQYFSVTEIPRAQSKYSFITNTLSGLASQGQLYASPTRHVEFFEHMEAYPNIQYPDLLDASAMALSVMAKMSYETDMVGDHSFSDVEPLELVRACP